MSLFKDALMRRNQNRPPVWFMRQAGRYHSHYQVLRRQSSFMDLCKNPKIAREATLGPINDFDFDAAILFSDLLFPLEAMGMGLSYDTGKPKLEWHLKTTQDLEKLKSNETLYSYFTFQADALKLIRQSLSHEKGLLGFVGGPLTLFFYAACGSHQGSLESAKQGLTDGRFHGFCEKLIPLLAQNMALQAQAGADTIAIFDTCAGEVNPEMYQELVIPVLKELFHRFKKLCPDTPLTYYSKNTGPSHWDALKALPITCLGIDWNHDLVEVLKNYGSHFAIQGNIDSHWLLLEPQELERRLRKVFSQVLGLNPDYRKGWICGLGHGVLPQTPESNVRLFLKLQKEIF